jgi:hypothetical protein
MREHTDEKVSVVIADAAGKTVRELGGSGRPGMNRVVWDLQPEESQRLPNRDADLGQKAFVPPGEYRVTVTCGKRKASGTVAVLEAPR